MLGLAARVLWHAEGHGGDGCGGFPIAEPEEESIAPRGAADQGPEDKAVVFGDVGGHGDPPSGRPVERDRMAPSLGPTRLVRPEPGSTSPWGSVGLGERNRARVCERKRL